MSQPFFSYYKIRARFRNTNSACLQRRVSPMPIQGRSLLSLLSAFPAVLELKQNSCSVVKWLSHREDCALYFHRCGLRHFNLRRASGSAGAQMGFSVLVQPQPCPLAGPALPCSGLHGAWRLCKASWIHAVVACRTLR